MFGDYNAEKSWRMMATSIERTSIYKEPKKIDTEYVIIIQEIIYQKPK